MLAALHLYYSCCGKPRTSRNAALLPPTDLRTFDSRLRSPLVHMPAHIYARARALATDAVIANQKAVEADNALPWRPARSRAPASIRWGYVPPQPSLSVVCRPAWEGARDIDPGRCRGNARPNQRSGSDANAGDLTGMQEFCAHAIVCQSAIWPVGDELMATSRKACRLTCPLHAGYVALRSGHGGGP